MVFIFIFLSECNFSRSFLWYAAQENTNYFEFFLFKKNVVYQIHTVCLATQTIHFLVNYGFGQKICSKIKLVGEKGKVKFFLNGREMKKKGGGTKLLRWCNYVGLSCPLITLFPHTLIMWIFICTWSQSI